MKMSVTWGTPVIMLFAFFLGVLLVSFTRAAERNEFYHLRAEEEIESVLDTPELYTKLDLLNLDSRFYEISRPALETDSIEDYVEAQESIAKLLCRSESVNFKSPQMETFASYLLTSFERDTDLFSFSKLPDVLGILFASSSPKQVFQVRALFEKAIPQLKLVQRSRTLKYLLRFASIETCYIVPTFLSVDFFSESGISSFLNNYVSTVLSKFTCDNDYARYSNKIIITLFAVTHEKVHLSTESYELILNALKKSNSFFDIQYIPKLLKLLSFSVDRFSEKQGNLFELLADVILCDKVIAFIGSTDFNSDYLNLFHKCSKKTVEKFKNSLLNLNTETLKHFEAYTDKFMDYSKSLACLSHLMKLSTNSDEFGFRLGLSSAKSLHQILKKNQSIIKAIPKIEFQISKIQVLIAEVFTDNCHPYNLQGLQIMAYVSLIDFDLCDASDNFHVIAGNISYTIGHLLVYVKDPTQFPWELVAAVTPILDQIIDGTLIARRNAEEPATTIELSADLKFVKLHHSEKTIRFATNQLCLSLIISMPIRARGYLYVKELPDTDEMEIAKAGFSHFLRKQPIADEDVPHLKRYYNYLEQRGFLSKTEILILEKYFRTL